MTRSRSPSPGPRREGPAAENRSRARQQRRYRRDRSARRESLLPSGAPTDGAKWDQHPPATGPRDGATDLHHLYITRMLPQSRTRWRSPQRIGIDRRARVGGRHRGLHHFDDRTSRERYRVVVAAGCLLRRFGHSPDHWIGHEPEPERIGVRRPVLRRHVLRLQRPNFTSGSGATQGKIISGNTTGATVRFSLDQSGQLFQGVLTDSAMSGSGTISYNGSSGSETFTGTWTAERTK